MIFAFIAEILPLQLAAAANVIDDGIMKKFWHNIERSFHIWGQIEAVFNNSKFTKWPPLWAGDRFSYRKLYRKLNISEI